MRSGKIELSPGYDGEFGKIKMFRPSEREILLGQKSLFSLTGKISKTVKSKPVCNKRLDLPAGFTEQPEKMITTRRWDETVDRTVCGDGTALNREQCSAVEHPANTLLIVAGPGTGKTLTLTQRIAYLIAHKNISPHNILALTFTHQAARQMRRRLRMLLPERRQLPLVTTFHSFCYQILQEPNTTGTSILIADDFDQKYFIHKTLELLEKDGVHIPFKPQEILDRIISAKQRILRSQDNLESVVNKSEIEIVAIVYQAYQKLLSISGYYDYEDLIFKIVRRLESDDNTRKKIQNRFQYILIDEYQDLNHGQYRIVRALSPPGKNLFVIGDPNQSVYGFRGSEVRYFEQFLKDYPDAEVIHLKQNYRSTQTILDAAIQVMAFKNSRKNLEIEIYSKIEGVKTLNIIEAVSEKAEAVSIGQYIEKMVGGIGFYSIDFNKIDTTDENATCSFSDFAVLYRTRHQGEIIADVLHKAGIPYQLVSREDVFHKKGLADLLSFLRMFEGIGSYLDFERMMKLTALDIGEKSVANFTAWGFKNKWEFSQTLQNVRRFPIRGMKKNVQQKFYNVSAKLLQIKEQIQALHIEKRLRFILENRVIPPTAEAKARLEAAFINSIGIFQKFDTHKPEFLSKIGLESDTDIYNPRSEKVALLTMHAAKGLEFPVVFISGCENGFIPFQRPGDASADINEERRLFYVALTRARERLFLTYAKKRRIHGKTVTRQPSPFINNIQKHLKRHRTPKMPKIKDELAVQLKLF
jgi:superfamily I DNA/RNA helicase